LRILVLGGTRFLGRHLVASALGRGHEVTLFHRGVTHPGLFSDSPRAEELFGDRNGDLSPLAGRRWDVAIDTSGYEPGPVRASAELLAGTVELYLFISTISVYSRLEEPGTTEESPVHDPPPDNYGGNKVLCERAVEEALPGRNLRLRPGLLVGPWDPSGRFGFWVDRVARGGDVLAPGRPGRPLQVLDARDLAHWAIRLAEARAMGVYNVVGPADPTLGGPLTLGDLLETGRDLSGSDAAFTWVDDRFLEDRDMKLPLWVPEESQAGFDRVDNRRAMAAGLRTRPLRETVRDTLEWLREHPEAARRDRLPEERERELLREWRGR
jgi:2'-hydroxyisoflavone reductase